MVSQIPSPQCIIHRLDPFNHIQLALRRLRQINAFIWNIVCALLLVGEKMYSRVAMKLADLRRTFKMELLALSSCENLRLKNLPRISNITIQYFSVMFSVFELVLESIHFYSQITYSLLNTSVFSGAAFHGDNQYVQGSSEIYFASLKRTTYMSRGRFP